MRQRVGCAVCRMLPNMLLPVEKLELGISELVLFNMEQVLEGLLWEMLWRFSSHSSKKRTTPASTDHTARMENEANVRQL